MTRYTISFDLWDRRRSFTVPCWPRLARFVGRHVWRLGRRRWQIEAGRFPTSYIPTQGEPVKRHADRFGPYISELATSGADTQVLVESERTNIALWSEGRAEVTGDSETGADR